VPPAALRAGDFSQAFNEDGTLQVIYDPLTGNPDGTGRSPFPGNVIPQSRISAIAQQLQALYPQPNLPGSLSSGNVGGAAISRNFQRDQPRRFDRNNYDLKINWNLSNQAQVWGKYSRMGATVLSPRDFLGYDGSLTGDTTVNQYTFGTTWTLNPKTVLDATLGISKMNHESVGGDSGEGNFGLDVLGIPGFNGGGNFSDDPRYAGIPAVTTSGFATLGNNDGWVPVQRDERTYAFAANVTRMEGAHELRFGYSLNRLRMDHWQPELGSGPRGLFESGADTTALNGGAQSSNQYNAYAALLLGLASHAGTSVQYEVMTTREWQHAGYVRDRWQVSPKLTVDVGLRYEYYPLMQRADRGIEQVDLSNLTVRLGGLGGNPTDLGISVSKTLFAPRLGAVYRINDDTVLRSGYGITYNPLPFSRPLRGFYPLTLAADYYAPNPFASAATLASGIPDVVGPDLSSGRIPLPNEYGMRTPRDDVSRSRIHSWNVSFERRIPYDISLDIAYVGTAKNGGFADININASDTPGGGVTSQPFYAVFGRQNSLELWGPLTKSRYNSLQVALNRPFKKGLLLKGAYTWSHAKNETDDDGWAGLMWNGASQLSRNYATAGYDRPHVFQMAFVYEVPYKSNADGNRAAHWVLGDWQINGVYSAYAGSPFTVVASGATLNMAGNQQTANLNGSYDIVGEIGDAGFFFTPTPFTQPQGLTFGNTGRNQFRGPGAWNLDFSLFRGFPMGAAGRRLEFRAEFFNLTNHPKFANPDADLSSSTFGRIYTAGDGSRDAGSGERQIRLGLRFQF
jgi:hypothetical protein